MPPLNPLEYRRRLPLAPELARRLSLAPQAPAIAPEEEPGNPMREEYLRSLRESPRMPRLRPELGPGAFEDAGGRVQAPGKLAQILGAFGTGATAAMEGQEAARKYQARYELSPYMRARAPYEEAETKRQGRMKELLPLVQLEEQGTNRLAIAKEANRERARAAMERRLGMADLRAERMAARREAAAARNAPEQLIDMTPLADILGKPELRGKMVSKSVADNLIQYLSAQAKPAVTKLLTPEEEAQQIRLRRASQTAAGGGIPISPPGTPPAQILSKYPAEIQQKAKMLLEYKVPATSYMLTRSPEWVAAAEAASESDPTWNSTEYPSRLKLLTEFKTGNASRNVRSLNTLIGHLDSLKKTADKLDNRSVQLWNLVVNKGYTAVGDSRVTNFEKAAAAVSSEAATLFKGTAGTDQEIKEWRSTINASQSPEQLQDGIKQMMDLMASRLNALTQQYEIGMGRPKDLRLLNDKSAKILRDMNVGDLEGGVGRPQGGQAPARPIGVPATINTQAEYDALPGGASYKDGRTGEMKRKAGQ